MLITFKGRKSQRVYTTPVRYVANDGAVRCFTSPENLWWRNLRGGADVVLRIEGTEKRYRATAIENEPETTKRWLKYYLSLFPQDATYHDIRLEKDKSVVAADLERASHKAIVVVATPLD